MGCSYDDIGSCSAAARIVPRGEHAIIGCRVEILISGKTGKAYDSDTLGRL